MTKKASLVSPLSNLISAFGNLQCNATSSTQPQEYKKLDGVLIVSMWLWLISQWLSSDTPDFFNSHCEHFGGLSSSISAG